MINTAPNYAGKLTLYQIQALLDGLAKIEQRKSESVEQGQSSGGRKNITELGQLKKFPGIKHIKKK